MSKKEKKPGSGYYTERMKDASADLPPDFIKEVQAQLNESSFIRKRKPKSIKKESEKDKTSEQEKG